MHTATTETWLCSWLTAKTRPRKTFSPPQTKCHNEFWASSQNQLSDHAVVTDL